MNPILLILTQLSDLKNNIRARFNKALEGLGPIEQVEASQQLIGVLREVDWAQHRITEISASVDEQVTKAETMLATYAQESIAAAITEKVTAGELIRKEDHETLITAAEKKGKDEVRQEFQAAADRAQKIAENRNKLVTDHGVHVAAALTDEDLTADDSADRIARITARTKKLTDAGIPADGATEKFHASMLSCAPTEAGDAEFNSRLEAFTATGFKAAAAPIAPKTPPSVLPTNPNNTSKHLLA